MKVIIKAGLLRKVEKKDVESVEISNNGVKINGVPLSQLNLNDFNAFSISWHDGKIESVELVPQETEES